MAVRGKLVPNRSAVGLITARAAVALRIAAVVLARIADVSWSIREANSQLRQNKHQGNDPSPDHFVGAAVSHACAGQC